MKRLIFTGGYMLTNTDPKTQFGIVSGSTYLGEYTPKIKLLLGRQVLERIRIDDDSMTIDLSIEECSKLAETLKKVEDAIQLLISLSKRGRLKEDFYLDDSTDSTEV